jgi:hypothetical protein
MDLLRHAFGLGYLRLMENDLGKYFPLLGWKAGVSFHVGAHKFEELPAYVKLGFIRVLWFDPIPDYLPKVLPAGHAFYSELIMNRDSEISFNFYESASGFSSIYTPKNNKLLHSKIDRPVEKMVTARKLSHWQLIISKDEAAADEFVTVSISSQGSELDVLLSADLTKISQIMVRTSKFPIYVGANESRNSIHKLLKENGFYLNLDLADLIFGHGFQYWSRENKKFYVLLSARYKFNNLVHFLISLTRRGLISISTQLKLK